MKVVSALRSELGLPKLKVVMNPVTSANRIPLMANGTIDLECGSTTNNLERQQQVAFAPTMFVIGSRLLSKRSSNIKALADMKGKTLVATAGTSTPKQMTMLNKENNLGIPRGQKLAGQALGVTSQVTGTIVLPQAIRNMLPVLLTQTIILFQDVSLVYVLSIPDFVGAASKVAQRDGRLVELYSFVAVVYFVLCFALSSAVRRVHHRAAVPR